MTISDEDRDAENELKLLIGSTKQGVGVATAAENNWQSK